MANKFLCFVNKRKCSISTHKNWDMGEVNIDYLKKINH